MKKLIIFVLSILFIVQSTYAYNLTQKDVIVAQKASVILEKFISKKGENYRNYLITKLDEYRKLKFTNNQRKYEIIGLTVDLLKGDNINFESLFSETSDNIIQTNNASTQVKTNDITDTSTTNNIQNVTVTNQASSRKCIIENGEGQEIYSNNSWGNCNVTSCNSGYEKSGDKCLLKTNNTTTDNSGTTQTQISFVETQILENKDINTTQNFLNLSKKDYKLFSLEFNAQSEYALKGLFLQFTGGPGDNWFDNIYIKDENGVLISPNKTYNKYGINFDNLTFKVKKGLNKIGFFIDITNNENFLDKTFNFNLNISKIELRDGNLLKPNINDINYTFENYKIFDASLVGALVTSCQGYYTTNNLIFGENNLLCLGLATDYIGGRVKLKSFDLEVYSSGVLLKTVKSLKPLDNIILSTNTINNNSINKILLNSDFFIESGTTQYLIIKGDLSNITNSSSLKLKISNIVGISENTGREILNKNKDVLIKEFKGY